jgi:hypothetical protein
LGVAAALMAVFIVMSLVSEFRAPRQGTHGRLYNARTRDVEVPKAIVPAPVIEARVRADAMAADPLLLSAAAREQYLGTETATAEATATVTGVGYYVASRAGLPQLSGGSFVDVEDEAVVYRPERPLLRDAEGRLVIAGGAEGVAIQHR